MNKAILIGRLTKDPELRHTTSGRSSTQFSVAISRPFTNQSGERETDFIQVVVWDKQAENVCKYLSKGRLVAVEGRIQTRNYDDKDGKKVYVTEVVANNVQFLESKGSTGNAMPVEDNPFEGGHTETVSVEKDPFESFGESISISDNDLPF
jgi:single-strand DNA-binding protein